MTETIGVSVRSLLIAGISAAVVGTVAVTPPHMPTPAAASVSATVELASITSGLDGVVNNLKGVVSGIDGIFTNLNAFANGVQATVNHVLAIPDSIQASIKQAYDTAERWPAYAAAWAHFSLGLIPGLWWIAPSVPLAYNTAEPLARAGVYSVADIVGLDPAQFAQDISAGIKSSSDNAATYGKAWAASLVRVPTLPPYPGPPPGSPDYSGQPLAAAATPEATSPQAAAVTSGIESAIKNTYNAIEPWAAWGAELVQWGMGFVPGLWWLAPGVSLGYFTVEPLVQAGVFTVADVLGLNFSQIGPDIKSGIQQSTQNLVTYGLAWLQNLIPFPPLPPFPPRPFAAVSAPTAALRAAAAVSAPEATTDTPQTPAPAGEKPTTDTTAVTDKTTPAVDTRATDTTGTDTTSAAGEAAPAVATAAETTTPATATDTGAQPTGAPGPALSDPESPAVAQSPSAAEIAPSRGSHLGQRTPTSEGAAPKSGATDNPESAKPSHRGRSAQ